MGQELHIVRIPESEENQITADEWLQCISDDSEISRFESSDHPKGWIYAKVSGAEDWESLYWRDGMISARAPQTKMTAKMLDLAELLAAVVQTDEGITLRWGENGRIEAEEF